MGYMMAGRYNGRAKWLAHLAQDYMTVGDEVNEMARIKWEKIQHRCPITSRYTWLFELQALWRYSIDAI